MAPATQQQCRRRREATKDMTSPTDAADRRRPKTITYNLTVEGGLSRGKNDRIVVL